MDSEERAIRAHPPRERGGVLESVPRDIRVFALYSYDMLGLSKPILLVLLNRLFLSSTLYCVVVIL